MQYPYRNGRSSTLLITKKHTTNTHAHTNSQSHCSHDIWNKNVNNDLCTYKIIARYYLPSNPNKNTINMCGDDNREPKYQWN